MKETIDVLRTMIKELDNRGQEMVTPQRLFKEWSRSRIRSRSAQKHRKSISSKKGISKSHRSARSKAQSRSKPKSVKSKPQSGRVLAPSCCVIFDLEPLSLSFDFVFKSEIFKSFLVCLCRLCHLAILYLDEHAHTLHQLESLLTISLDNLCLDNLDIFKEDLKYHSFKLEHEHVVMNQTKLEWIATPSAFKRLEINRYGRIWLCHSSKFGSEYLRFHEERPVIE
ncbi:hypothetical protein Tco_0568122 [Tanacetum coccineum]